MVVTDPPARFSIKRTLVVCALVAVAYSLALLLLGEGVPALPTPLWSGTGLLALLLCLVNYLLRGWRWCLWMAFMGRPMPLLAGLRCYLVGYVFTPTPGNLGEALRGTLLAQRPLSATQSLSVFGAERLADLSALLILCLPAVFWWWQHLAVLPAWAGWRSGLLALVLVVLAAVLLWSRVIAVVRRWVWLGTALACLRHRASLSMSLTLGAWLSQGVAVYLLCRLMGLDLALLTAVGFYAVAMVAGALSALPAGLGGTELALSGLLLLHGADATSALIITFVARILTLWLAVAIGMVAMAYSVLVARDIRF
ncbi:MAG: flippase-like domain-containing protein [Polaromonas sp.]|nr:flippase-like domain-containing protein [Polaromonas sp.]